MLQRGRAGRASSCSTAPTARTRSGTSCRGAVQEQIIDKQLRFYVIDGNRVAREAGMGGRINTVMQTCFFAISGVLPRDEAIAAIKHAIEKTYGKRGEAVVQKNYAAVDAALDAPARGRRCRRTVDQHARAAAARARRGARSSSSEVTAPDDRGRGRRAAGQRAAGRRHLSRPAPPQWEKRNIAAGDPGLGRGPLHPVRQVRAGLPARGHPRQGLRARRRWPARPTSFKSAPARWHGVRRRSATRCRSRPRTAPAARCASRSARPRTRARRGHKAINMAPQPPLRERGGGELGLLPRAARGRPAACST